MDFNTGGVGALGLLRALQGDVMAAAAMITVAILAMIVARRAIGPNGWVALDDPLAITKARATVTRITGLAIALTLAALAMRVATVTAVNRMPRADADPSGVYRQMKDNANQPAPPAAPR